MARVKLVYLGSALLMKEFRDSLGMSQPQLSKEIGYSVQMISNWERGVCSPPARALKAIDKKYKQFNLNEFIQVVTTDQLAELRLKWFQKLNLKTKVVNNATTK